MHGNIEINRKQILHGSMLFGEYLLRWIYGFGNMMQIPYLWLCNNDYSFGKMMQLYRSAIMIMILAKMIQKRICNTY